MLQKNRGESEILEMKKTYKIRSWEFPRGHCLLKEAELNFHFSTKRIFVMQPVRNYYTNLKINTKLLSRGMKS